MKPEGDIVAMPVVKTRDPENVFLYFDGSENELGPQLVTWQLLSLWHIV